MKPVPPVGYIGTIQDYYDGWTNPSSYPSVLHITKEAATAEAQAAASKKSGFYSPGTIKIDLSVLLDG